MTEHLFPGRRLGRRKPDRTRPLLHLSRFFRPGHGALRAPASADHLSAVTQWVLGQNTKFGTCVTPDTRVLTADLQWVPAGDLMAGDRLLGIDEQASSRGRSYRAGTVETAEIVRKPCYDLRFEDGTTVRCSADHRWLTARHGQQWIRTDELKCGAVNQSKVVKPLDVWDNDTSREAGYLAGAFDGEGSLEQTRHGVNANRICFCQTQNEMLAEVERCLKELGYRYNHTITSNGTRLRADGTPRKDKHRIEVSPRPEYIRFLGSIRPVRLLPKLDANRLGRINGRVVRLVSKNFAGEHDVVLLETSSKTYIAEGLACHNCGPAGLSNSAVASWKYLLSQDITVTDDAVFDLYRRSGNPGFDPNGEPDADGNYPGDNGVDLATMLQAATDGGLEITHADGTTETIRPVAYAALLPSDGIEGIRACTAVLGGVLFGFDLEQAQQQQTDTRLWDYTPSPPWGGHCTWGAAYTSQSGAGQADETVITWQMPVGCTDAFLRHQVDEGFGVVWEPHLSSPSFLGSVDVAQFAAEYRALTGNPFPGR